MLHAETTEKTLKIENCNTDQSSFRHVPSYRFQLYVPIAVTYTKQVQCDKKEEEKPPKKPRIKLMWERVVFAVAKSVLFCWKRSASYKRSTAYFSYHLLVFSLVFFVLFRCFVFVAFLCIFYAIFLNFTSPLVSFSCSRAYIKKKQARAYSWLFNKIAMERERYRGYQAPLIMLFCAF